MNLFSTHCPENVLAPTPALPRSGVAGRQWRGGRTSGVKSLPGWRALLCVVLSFSPAQAAPENTEAGLAMRLLRSNCLSCHDEEKRKGGLSLGSRESLIKGGSEGPVIVEGKPGESTLITSLGAAADPHMPPKKQFSAAQIKVLEDWVRRGTPWDAAALAGEAPAPRPVALAALPEAFHPVMAMALSPDGTCLAVGCRNEVHVFETGPAALVFRAKAGGVHLDAVQSLAWMPDGKRLVSGAFRRVIVWDAEPLAPRREIVAGLTGRVTALRPATDGTRVFLADGQEGENGFVRILDVNGGGTLRSWRAHEDTIFAMDLSRDGKLLATAGGDKLVRLWNPEDGTETARLEAHSTQVLGLAFNQDASQLVTGGADRLLKVWDVKTKENTIAFAARPASFNAVLWNPSAPAVLAVTEDGVLLRYTDMKTHTGAQSSDSGNERQLGRSETPFYSLAITADGGRIFAGDGNGHLFGWDKDGKLLDNIDLTAAKPVTTAPK